MSAPPDNCPRCCVVTCPPLSVAPADGWEGIVATYRCGPCQHGWWTSWATYGLDLDPALALGGAA